MRLRNNINYSEFLMQVHLCHGEVLMVTEEGDQLNLKSALSQFVFLAAISGHVQFRNAGIRLMDSEDAALLGDYLEEEA